MRCVDVAGGVYETTQDEAMTDAAACRGIYRALWGLRDGNGDRRTS